MNGLGHDDCICQSGKAFVFVGPDLAERAVGLAAMTGEKEMEEEVEEEVEEEMEEEEEIVARGHRRRKKTSVRPTSPLGPTKRPIRLHNAVDISPIFLYESTSAQADCSDIELLEIREYQTIDDMFSKKFHVSLRQANSVDYPIYGDFRALDYYNKHCSLGAFAALLLGRFALYEMRHDLTIKADLYERLTTPFSLLRMSGKLFSLCRDAFDEFMTVGISGGREISISTTKLGLAKRAHFCENYSGVMVPEPSKDYSDIVNHPSRMRNCVSIAMNVFSKRISQNSEVEISLGDGDDYIVILGSAVLVEGKRAVIELSDFKESSEILLQSMQRLIKGIYDHNGAPLRLTSDTKDLGNLVFVAWTLYSLGHISQFSILCHPPISEHNSPKWACAILRSLVRQHLVYGLEEEEDEDEDSPGSLSGQSKSRMGDKVLEEHEGDEDLVLEGLAQLRLKRSNPHLIRPTPPPPSQQPQPPRGQTSGKSSLVQTFQPPAAIGAPTAPRSLTVVGGAAEQNSADGHVQDPKEVQITPASCIFHCACKGKGTNHRWCLRGPSQCHHDAPLPLSSIEVLERQSYMLLLALDVLLGYRFENATKRLKNSIEQPVDDKHFPLPLLKDFNLRTATAIENASSHLDETQKQAVLNSHAFRISAVRGPPGTGKTVVIGAIASSHLALGQRVIVLAHSNTATHRVLDTIDEKHTEDIEKTCLFVAKEFYFDWHEDSYDAHLNDYIMTPKEVWREKLNKDHDPLEPKPVHPHISKFGCVVDGDETHHGHAEAHFRDGDRIGTAAGSASQISDIKTIIATFNLAVRPVNDMAATSSPWISVVLATIDWSNVGAIIIDEASQVWHTLLLPILGRLADTRPHLVIIGDEHQLPPFQNALAEAKHCASVFDVVISHKSVPITQLSTSYRLSTHVGELLDEHIYKGGLSVSRNRTHDDTCNRLMKEVQLRISDEDLARPLIAAFLSVGVSGGGLLWIHRDSKADEVVVSPSSRSLGNYKEADILVQAMAPMIVALSNVKSDSRARGGRRQVHSSFTDWVHIQQAPRHHQLRRRPLYKVVAITPYDYQRSIIEQKLSEELYRRGQFQSGREALDFVQGSRLVNCVDGFQGQEADFVFLSLVRGAGRVNSGGGNGNTGSLGFLREDNRVNVMLSRARHGLFIFADVDFYATQLESPLLSVFAEDVRDSLVCFDYRPPFTNDKGEIVPESSAPHALAFPRLIQHNAP